VLSIIDNQWHFVCPMISNRSIRLSRGEHGRDRSSCLHSSIARAAVRAPGNLATQRPLSDSSRVPAVNVRRSLRDALRDVVLGRILDGTYPPGHRLIEMQLAAEFQTSQAPVREAIRQLEALRYVESRPNRGTYVRETRFQELCDSCIVRAALERAAAQAAATRVDARWIAGLKKAVKALEAAGKVRDVETYAVHDYAFHLAIVERANNPVLLFHWQQIVAPNRALIVLRTGAIDPADTAPEHRPILDALATGAGMRAGALAFAHADGMRRRLLKAAGASAPRPVVSTDQKPRASRTSGRRTPTT
jgi:DNA-binding GntR family transcriptional regulator